MRTFGTRLVGETRDFAAHVVNTRGTGRYSVEITWRTTAKLMRGTPLPTTLARFEGDFPSWGQAASSARAALRVAERIEDGARP
jgi:hypothetical protein